MFKRSSITPPEVNGFGWNLVYSEYIVWSWPWRILGAIRTEARAGDLAEVLFFCQLNNARLCRFPVNQISRNLHTRRDSVTWWIFPEYFFENLPLRHLFSKKTRDHRQQFPTWSHDFSEMITNLGKSWQVGTPMECWLSIRTVGIHSVIPLDSRVRTRKDFPGHRRRTQTLHYYKVVAGWQHHLDVALLLSFE